MENVTNKVLKNNELSYAFHGVATNLANLELLRIVRVKVEDYDFENIANGVFDGVFAETEEEKLLEIELQKEEYRQHVEASGVYDYSVEVRKTKNDAWERLQTFGGYIGVGDDIYGTSLDKDLLAEGVNWITKNVKFD